MRSEWCLYPCTSLGGDSLGHHWIDDGGFAVYLLDASGHGVGPALLSVSALNMIRSQTLPDTDFTSPASVLAALNRIFQMARHDNLYFTIWYGVFDVARRHLTYAGGRTPAGAVVRPRRRGRRAAHPELLHRRPARRGLRGEPGPAARRRRALRLFGRCLPDHPAGRRPAGRTTVSGRNCAGSERAGGDLEGCHRAALALHGGPSLEDDYTILRVKVLS